MSDPLAYKHHPIPVKTGIGLRAPHYREMVNKLPNVGWLEVHSENFFGPGGHPLHVLELLRLHYPLSLHGVGLFPGSTQPPDKEHLKKIKSLIDRFDPFLVSEHLSWGSIPGRVLNDLLPLPYTPEALELVCSHISQIQDFLGRRILIENVSTYIEFKQSEILEWDFITEVSLRTGCGILLDINNIYVNSVNHSFDPLTYLNAIPPDSVGEIHLAGFENNADCLIDTHSRPVFAPVWDLFKYAIKHVSAAPTLIEWDADIPELDILLGEARKADSILENNYALSS